ncbi:MAG: lysostaphin resistance A-like protein [Acidimicrobiia bacterium]
MTQPAATSDRALAEAPAWGLGEVAIGLLLAIVGGNVTAGLALALSGEPRFDDLPLAWVALAQVGLWAGLLGMPAWAAATKGRGLVRDLRLRVTWGDVPLGLVVGVVLQLVVVPLLYVPLLPLLDRSRSDVEAPAREMADRAAGPLGVVLLVLIVGIAAPIVEEIFYRGLFQQALLKRGLPAAAAVGINAFVFAASHFQLLQFPALFAFGLAVGWLAWRRGRLGPAIAAHVAFNMVTVVALLVT